jgi:dynein heavy chain
MKNIEEFFQNKKMQKTCEDMILKLLYEAKGDLPNDEILIDALRTSKQEGQKVEEKLQNLEHDNEAYLSLRMQFKEVGKRVANLFFTVLDLSSVEPTYYWSLAFFISLYEKAVKESSHHKEVR